MGGSVDNGSLSQLVLLDNESLESSPPYIAISLGCVSNLENINCAFSDVCMGLVDKW